MIIQGLKKFLRNPGTFCFADPVRRNGYKKLCRGLISATLNKREKLASRLPAADDAWSIPKPMGFKSIPPGQTSRLDSYEKVARECARVIDSRRISSSKSKPYLKNLLEDTDITSNSCFIQFALEERILAAVTQYLGELPILASIKLLHSSAVTIDPDGSQLYHCDHDDDRQVKIFLHISDVDESSGPLTVIPANLSGEIRQKLNYRYGGKSGHLPDSIMRSEEVLKSEQSILGTKGTLSLVDTSSVFHFGSRVASKDRYIFFLQYLTNSSFIFNPLSLFAPKSIRERLSYLPYSHLESSSFSPLHNAVLTGRS